jgi:hypothetical protein
MLSVDRLFVTEHFFIPIKDGPLSENTDRDSVRVYAQISDGKNVHRFESQVLPRSLATDELQATYAEQWKKDFLKMYPQ